MQILSKMASYSYAESDLIRRAISKKKLNVIEEERSKFITNSVKNGYTKEVAEEVYELIVKFANYGFNKSHSVAYAVVGYQMCFLKTHYPIYFYTALLNFNIGSETKTKEYIDEREGALQDQIDGLNIPNQAAIDERVSQGISAATPGIKTSVMADAVAKTDYEADKATFALSEEVNLQIQELSDNFDEEKEKRDQEKKENDEAQTKTEEHKQYVIEQLTLFEGRISTLESGLSVLQSTVNTLTENMNSKADQSEVDNKADASVVSEFNETIQQLKDQIKTLEDELETLKDSKLNHSSIGGASIGTEGFDGDICPDIINDATPQEVLDDQGNVMKEEDGRSIFEYDNLALRISATGYSEANDFSDPDKDIWELVSGQKVTIYPFVMESDYYQTAYDGGWKYTFKITASQNAGIISYYSTEGRLVQIASSSLYWSYLPLSIQCYYENEIHTITVFNNDGDRVSNTDIDFSKGITIEII
jgi:hypothetical protein